MGSDLGLQDLLEFRIAIVEDVLNSMRNWDNNIESGISLIESNQVSLDKLKTLNSELNRFDAVSIIDEKYNDNLKLISQELEKLTNSLKCKQDNLLEGKQQLNKKNQVFNSYISVKKESVFIDKDVK